VILTKIGGDAMKRMATITMMVLAAMAGGATFPALAQDYPAHPIRMIIGYGTGGVTDITTRAVTPFIAEVLNGNIIVDNRPGASTMIGTEAVVKSKPDGYTLLLASGAAIAANPVLFKSMPYDATKDLAGISLVATVPYVLVVHPDVPAKTVGELIALAKAKPKGVSYSSAGNGSGNHLTAELFAKAAGIDVQHIPYKSGGAMVTDLIGGHVQFAFAALPTAIAFIKGGKIRAIAVSSKVRDPNLPDVPTVIESGVADFVVDEWLGIFAPTGTPAPIIDKLNAATVKALQNPELVAKLKGLGGQPVSSTPAQLEALLKSDLARWTKLAQQVKFEAQ
jgi:tripartite-type tricarboxylate transporter receptor subunit TctC